MKAFVPNLDFIRTKYDPKLADALQAMMDNLNTVAEQTNANPTGEVGPPPPIQQVNVTAANGAFNVQIVDNGEVYRGIRYFVEYSPTATFTQPTVLHLGPSRNSPPIFLGNATYYFRAFSQYSTSDPSAPVYFGTAIAPTPVVGGGVITVTPLASSGSGTANSNGLQGAAGFGKVPYRPTSAGTPPRTTN